MAASGERVAAQERVKPVATCLCSTRNMQGYCSNHLKSDIPRRRSGQRAHMKFPGRRCRQYFHVEESRFLSRCWVPWEVMMGTDDATVLEPAVAGTVKADTA